MYVKYDARLHGPRVPGRQPPLTVHFLKKFLTIVKRRCRCCLARTDCVGQMGLS